MCAINLEGDIVGIVTRCDLTIESVQHKQDALYASILMRSPLFVPVRGSPHRAIVRDPRRTTGQHERDGLNAGEGNEARGRGLACVL